MAGEKYAFCGGCIHQGKDGCELDEPHLLRYEYPDGIPYGCEDGEDDSE